MASVLRCAFLLFTTLAINCDCSNVCLSCTDLKEGEQCQHIATCHDNEKYTTSQKETRYDVGCVDQQMCPVQDLQNTFGKRTSDHSRILCQRCCNNTYIYICNIDLTCVNPNNRNSNIHEISTNGSPELGVILVNINGTKAYANYSNFFAEDEHNQFLLHVTGYSGTARDAMGLGGNSGGDMHKFSTKDRDNDDKNNLSCGQSYIGGWWYGYCRASGINEMYHNGSLYSKGFPSAISSILMIRRT